MDIWLSILTVALAYVVIIVTPGPNFLVTVKNSLAHSRHIGFYTALAEIAQVLSVPEQTEMVRPGRAVYQSRVEFGESPQSYLLRVFVDIDRRPAEVVTAYRTSKIKKYWRQEL